MALKDEDHGNGYLDRGAFADGATDECLSQHFVFRPVKEEDGSDFARQNITSNGLTLSLPFAPRAESDSRVI